MIKNSIIWSIRVGAVATAFILVCTSTGCSGDDDDDGTTTAKGGDGAKETGGSDDGAGTGGSDDGAGDGGSSGESNALPYRSPTEECAFEDPPLDDPFCYNPSCPLANLESVTEENTYMGDCCNSIDVQRREEGMKEGERYDLEVVWWSDLIQNNPNLANPTITAMMLNTALAGGDTILMRFKQVPRTVDMTGPEEVTLEIMTGKLNCDGTFSFFGSNGAAAPVHDGPPNDPGRWAKRTLTVQYNGYEAEELVTMPGPEVVAETMKLTWKPYFKPDKADYEAPIEFLSMEMKVGDNWSCFGSVDLEGQWVMTAKLTVFVPVEESKLTTLADLGGQTLCGLLAYEPFIKSCDDGPQSEWPVKPTGYCDDDYFCWIGDSSDPGYADFWSRTYEGEDGCGEAHPCCDPAGTDSALEPCNAYYLELLGTVAAIDITDEDSNDPSKGISHRDICE